MSTTLKAVNAHRNGDANGFKHEDDITDHANGNGNGNGNGVDANGDSLKTELSQSSQSSEEDLTVNGKYGEDETDQVIKIKTR